MSENTVLNTANFMSIDKGFKLLTMVNVDCQIAQNLQMPRSTKIWFFILGHFQRGLTEIESLVALFHGHEMLTEIKGVGHHHSSLSASCL